MPFKRLFLEQRHYAERYGYVLVKIDDLDVTLTCMGCHINVEMNHIIVEYFTDNGQNWQEVSPWWNTGLCQWGPLPVVHSNQCLVRIGSLNDATVSDTSDETSVIFGCRKQLNGGVNGDCYVDLLDFAMLAGDWLRCGSPFDAHSD